MSRPAGVSRLILLRKADEFLMPVAAHALADDLPSSTIRTRHTCFCGLFPDPITASRRPVARTEPHFNALLHPYKLAYLRAGIFVSIYPPAPGPLSECNTIFALQMTG
jgi:hypothetical protein